MSNFNDIATTLSVKDWSGIMNGVPGITVEPFDKVEVTSGDGVTSFSFVNTVEENNKKTERQILLEALAKSDQPFKYIVMGRDDDYNEIDNCSLRPFGTIREAIAYGKKLMKRDFQGDRSYGSVVIQPLLKDKNSFDLKCDQIGILLDIENSRL